MRIPTRADGTPIAELEGVTNDRRNVSSQSSDHSPSMTFIVAISIILGLVIGLGSIVGALGGAFFVKRDEYTQKNLREAEETTTLRNTLNRVEYALSRQETAFGKLSDAVQAIEVNMARRR